MLFQQYVESAQQFFDDLVDRASDDELFAGGYLRGHFDLAVGYAQVEGEDLTPEELNEQIEKSLVKAYRNGCLLYTSPSPRDRQKSRMPSSA